MENAPSIYSEEKKEECGVMAAISKSKKPIAEMLYRGMLAVQHRGQDAAGLVMYDGSFYKKKGIGLVCEVVSEEDLRQPHWIGISQTRYPTTPTCTLSDVQPSISGILAVAHNGHLANYPALRKELEGKKYVFRGTVDSEVILYLLSEKLERGGSLQEATKHVMEKIDGAYSVVGIYDGQLFAFRDPHAIRPLVYGEGKDVVLVCSESIGLDINGVPYSGSIGPGELFIINEKGKIWRESIIKKEARHCMFEYVYFSRPDSIINGRLVDGARRELGRGLAKEAPANADVVIPIPDTARSAAIEYSRETRIPYVEGLIKNRYVGRTFIMPDQDSRIKAVRMKINPIKSSVEGKKVVLIDDSIVRGTTIREIVAMVRGAGAKEIHLRVTCPPIISPCFYGVDMPTYEELIADKKKIEEIKKYLGVDSLHYISLEGLKKAVGDECCAGCLTGQYPTKEAGRLAKEGRG
ncbi:MAG: amidophosphoribosyltransferase [Candidatus Bilamarchaeaceae archaeon]